MKNKLNKRLKRWRIVALYLAFNFLFNLIFPTVSMALTSGPSSPEFASFEPVATTDMVDPFTGNFTYNLPVLNIPGSDGGGYAMSLSYHSGTNSEEEASWVGCGWTLNAGAINRQKNGLVDEFKGVKVDRYNQTEPNWTVSTTVDGGIEVIAGDAPKKPEKQFNLSIASFDVIGESEGGGAAPWKLSPNATVRYNNYQGFSRTNGYSVGYKGMASLNMTRSGGESTFGYSVNPLAILLKHRRNKEFKAMIERMENEAKVSEGQVEMFNQLIASELREGEASSKAERLSKFMKVINPAISSSNVNTFSGYSVARTIGKAWNFSSSVKGNVFDVGLEVGYSGNMNYQVPIPHSEMMAYGYMHSPNWSDYYDDSEKAVVDPLNDGETDAKRQDSKIIADYSIERESSFNKHDNYLGIPFNSADQFIVSGESVMGGFRMHHHQVGTYYPTPVTNKQQIGQLGVEFGIGSPIEIGLDVGVGFQRTQVGNWRESRRDYITSDYDFPTTTYARFNNDRGGAIRYSESDDVYSAYFNKTNKKLRTAPVEDERAGLTFNQQKGYEAGASSQIIYSYYDADGGIHWNIWDEITNTSFTGALDKMEETEELLSVKPKDGIAEIATISATGEKYIYGLPVYARAEKQLTVREISPDGTPKKDVQAVGSTPTTIEMKVNSVEPLKNYSVVGDVIEEPYATAHLLTQITTPNYVDVNNNGPDEADFGGWTKFMYRQKHGGDADWYNHRAPYTGLFYNKGKINDAYDQTGSFSRGQKEIYYLKAVETKTHIACFITNETTSEDFTAIADRLFSTPEEKDAFKSRLEGSQEVRYDGMDAADENAEGLDKAAEGEMGTRKLEKLEKIVLFSKTRPSKPLTTTHFEYSYELCKGVPNSYTQDPDSPVYGQADKSGKLTLIKVWTESEGVVRAKIAPYQFKYNYHRTYGDAIRAKYPEITDGFFDRDGDGLADDWDEDPDYDTDLLDAWGNYVDAETAQEQHDKLRDWMSQRANPENFDPAAWNLKQIILPSGGEIHVQYEQKDYTHVQDEKAMTMVSLQEAGSQNGMKTDVKFERDDEKFNRYYLNLADLQLDGMDATHSPDELAYLRLLAEHFFDAESADNYATAMEMEDDGSGRYVNLKDQGLSPSAANGKAYFRFLYSYWDNLPTHFYQGTKGKFLSEFIDGYVPVNEIGLDANGIYLQFGGKKKNKFNVPRRLCRENLLTLGGNGLNREGHVWMDYEAVSEAIHKAAYHDPLPTELIEDDGTIGDEKEILKQIKKKIKDEDIPFLQFVRGVMEFGIKNPRLSKKEVCANLDYGMSYIKLPMLRAKKGGGIRVKRLLTYSSGIDVGEESLYGTEYIYKMEDGTSSGVATFEPAGQRVENPKVDILDRHKQKLFNKLLSGRDKKYQEGPLGEQLYPGASVAHRRVVVRNIHTGRTAPGFAVNSYLTCKDYPSVQVENTKIHESDDKRVNKESEHYKKFKINLPLGLFNFKRDNAWVTQGYLFKVDDRHGKVKSTVTYGGNINPEFPGITNGNVVLSSTEYEYSELDDVHTGVHMDGRTFVKNDQYRPGEEEDLTMYMGKVEDVTNDFNLELDLNIWIQAPPLFSLGLMPNISMVETQLAQHVTNRVIRRNTVVTKVTSVVDGIKSVTENLAYDENTGGAIITRTTDQYAGINSRLRNDLPEAGEHQYYSFNIPASWVYPELGQRVKNRNHLNLLTANAGGIVTYMSNPLDKFTDLDEDGTFTWNPYESPIQNVVEASAVELRNNRFDAEITSLDGAGTIEMDGIRDAYGIDDGLAAQLNKFWYPVASYIYTSETTSGNEADNSYEGGILEDFTWFKWKTDDDPTPFAENIANQWKYVAEVTKFSPFAQPLEEVNILGIPSAAKFGYGKLLPTMVGANAEFETMAFEDFEYDSDFYFETDAIAHTGKHSVAYESLASGKLLSGIRLTDRLVENGGYFKVWLSSQLEGLTENTTIPTIQIGGNEYDLKKVARVGEWVLFQAYITDWSGIAVGTDMDIYLNYDQMAGETLYVDDVCFNPLESSINCSVYDPTSFRLLAQFGDQHFATIYEYDTEGQLVRTIIETERGRKTIQEQQHNSPRVER